jgi:hypothetical protein
MCGVLSSCVATQHGKTDHSRVGEELLFLLTGLTNAGHALYSYIHSCSHIILLLSEIMGRATFEKRLTVELGKAHASSRLTRGIK